MNATDEDFINQQREPKAASPKSIGYLKDLSTSRIWTGAIAELPAQWQTVFSDIIHSDEGADKKFAQADVSKFINLLKSCPEGYVSKHNRDGTINFGTIPQPLEDGMYRRASDGVIFKVYHTVHGSNQQVAKELQIEHYHGDAFPEGQKAKVHFEYVGKAPLRTLTAEDRMTVHDAIEFGKLYGSCAICGRMLTNELSIQIGIGPVCGGREFGGEFQFLIDNAKLELEGKTGVKVLDAIESGEVEASEVMLDHAIDQMSEEELRARLAHINEELADNE